MSNPKLVLIVGCLGLLSNILGLFLFHDHGHAHGGHSHGHSHDHSHDTLIEAENGHSHEITDQAGTSEFVQPESLTTVQERNVVKEQQQQQQQQQQLDGSPTSLRTRNASGASHRRHHRQSSGTRQRFRSLTEDDNIHPASFRNSIIAASRMEAIDSADATESEGEEINTKQDATESSPLITKISACGATLPLTGHNIGVSEAQTANAHANHKHTQPKSSEKSGHSHADLNMRGLFLHVLGDALGNVGVIASALVIWLTEYSWRFYADPLVSLAITCIILTSAIPLVKAAARILLQAVPAGIDVEDIIDDIMELDGVVNCHHVHVWQLTDTKLISSLHVVVGYDFKGEGSARYMKLAQSVRECLHAYGIHSSTIQPEFNLHHLSLNGDAIDTGSTSSPSNRESSRRESLHSENQLCLLDCGDNCADGSQCCAPNTIE